MNLTFNGRTFTNIDSDMVGLYKFCNALDNYTKEQQKLVNKASSKAAAIAKKSIRSRVPKKTGTLKRALTTKAERTKLKGKKVRQITFKQSDNDLLQKPIKRPGLYGGKHAYWGYYPASQEYGFLTRAKDGGIEYRTFSRLTDYREKDKSGRWRRKRADELVKGYASRKVEGKHYMREGAVAVEGQVVEVVISTVEVGLKKLCREATHV